MLKVITSKKLPTKNKEWGFYGTIKTATAVSDTTVQKSWNAMVNKLHELYPLKEPSVLVKLLDNRVGRHLADKIADMPGKRKIATIRQRIAELTATEMNKWWRYYYERG